MKGTDKNAAIEIGAVFGFHSIKRFSVMRKFSPLPDGCFIVDVADSRHQHVIERDLADSHSTALRAANIFARLLGKRFPPRIESRLRPGDCDVVPLHCIGMTHFTLRQRLGKGENVGLSTTLDLFQQIRRRSKRVAFSPFLIANSQNSNGTPRDECVVVVGVLHGI